MLCDQCLRYSAASSRSRSIFGRTYLLNMFPLFRWLRRPTRRVSCWLATLRGRWSRWCGHCPPSRPWRRRHMVTNFRCSCHIECSLNGDGGRMRMCNVEGTGMRRLNRCCRLACHCRRTRPGRRAIVGGHIVRLTGNEPDKFDEKCLGKRRGQFHVDDILAETIQHFFRIDVSVWRKV